MKMRAESKSYTALHYQRVKSGTAPGRTGAQAAGAVELTSADPGYPPRLGSIGSALYARGDLGLLAHRLTAVFSSIKAPGSAILQGLNWAKSFPLTDSAVISGFHSPLEQECLNLLLQRAVPVIACPAREIARYRLPVTWQAAIDARRLLVVSPFKIEARITAATSATRNALVAHLADEIIVLHAGTGGATEKLAQEWVMRGKPVRTVAESNGAVSGEGS